MNGGKDGRRESEWEREGVLLPPSHPHTLRTLLPGIARCRVAKTPIWPPLIRKGSDSKFATQILKVVYICHVASGCVISSCVF